MVGWLVVVVVVVLVSIVMSSRRPQLEIRTIRWEQISFEFIICSA